MRARLCLIVCLIGAITATAKAGSEIKESKETVPWTPFDKGRVEFQFGVGAFSSFQQVTETRPGFTDLDAAVRLGTMLCTPSGEGLLRGNCEFLAEAYGAALVEGPGTGYAGITLILRYNFVQPNAHWVPYFQVQAGGVYNDIYQDGAQRVFGRSLEFDLGAGLGMRYLVNDRLALFLESDYRHVSNADTAARNLGLNSIGGLLGVSVFY